nr:putative ORF1 [Picobirnavirus sp.]
MTANQINFYKAKQEAKHWKRSDKETARHNLKDEAIREQSNTIQAWWNQQQAAHLVRSDAINQAHYERMDKETARHNAKEEAIQMVYLQDIDIPMADAKIDEITASAHSISLNTLSDIDLKAEQAHYYYLQSKFYPQYFALDASSNQASNFAKYGGVITDAVSMLLPQVRINFSGGAASTLSAGTGVNSSGRFSNYSVRMGK